MGVDLSGFGRYKTLVEAAKYDGRDLALLRFCTSKTVVTTLVRATTETTPSTT